MARSTADKRKLGFAVAGIVSFSSLGLPEIILVLSSCKDCPSETKEKEGDFTLGFLAN
jgi:hypothetical protein